MKHPDLYLPSSLPPARLEIPHERSAVVDLVVTLQRELLAARRTADALHFRAHGRPIAWSAAPRYAKLRYRPLIFGSSPSASARSALPFDDATGDGLALREIGHHLGVASTNAVNDHLNVLVRKGVLVRNTNHGPTSKGKARALRLVETPRSREQEALAQLRAMAGWVREDPICGVVAAALDHLIVLMTHRYPETT
jgi:hypothetical protein